MQKITLPFVRGKILVARWPELEFTFIDLFAGIGGIRIGFEEAGGKCVFSCENSKFSQKTYEAFFGERPDFSSIGEERFNGDIVKLTDEGKIQKIPEHNILAAGFPCQPFSFAGVSKKNSMGRPHGFEDPAQGTLFFNIREIIKTKLPAAVFLENVKFLISHNKEKTFRTILKQLSEVGYDVAWRIVDARHWVPQHRERIYIFAFRRPDCPGLGNSVQKWKIDIFAFQRALDCLSPFGRPITLDNVIEERVPEKYTLSTGTWEALLRHKEKHRAKGNGFGFGIIQPPYHGKITRTLSARYYKDGAEILISREEPRPRRLTPLECSRLMGFPEKYQRFFQRENIDYPQPVSDFQAYRQLGNSVAVPVIRDLARFMVTEMIKNGVFEKQPVKQAVE